MKSIFLSRTVWFNVVTAAAAYAGYLPKDYAAVAIPLANLVLRYLTTTAVSVTGKGPAGRPDQGI